MNLVEDLKYRELIYDMTDKALVDELNKGKMVFYMGVDPTADSLHIGHLVAYLTARRIENAGNKAILLIGGATGLIGDPRGSSERELLTLEKSLENGRAISNQVKNLFNVEVANNYDWISKIDMITFLRDYGKSFNVNYMINKETVSKRLETGISYTEFSYQILQALDFEHLYKTKKCNLQIGGQDQWGNITSGIELIRKHHGHEAKVYGLTFPLITKSDGTKFGKSESGTVWLDAKKTSPYEFYQFWYNTKDNDAVKYLKQFTFLKKDEIEKIKLEFDKKPEDRLAQKELAKNITVMVHGKKAFDEVINISNAFFNGDYISLTKSEIEICFSEAPFLNISMDKGILDILVESFLASSKRQAREFVISKAVYVNNKVVTDISFTVSKDNALHKTFSIIRRGKKKYLLVKHG